MASVAASDGEWEGPTRVAASELVSHDRTEGGPAGAAARGRDGGRWRHCSWGEGGRWRHCSWQGRGEGVQTASLLAVEKGKTRLPKRERERERVLVEARLTSGGGLRSSVFGFRGVHPVLGFMKRCIGLRSD